MSIDYPVWSGEQWLQLPIPAMGGEGLVVPNVAAVVYTEDRSQVLLQRRDKPNEVTQGRLEVPGGRWQAGESAQAALSREVMEETGIALLEVISGATRHDFADGLAVETTTPRAVVSGLEGAYPALQVVYECIGQGVPRALAGETAAPAWWAIADVLSHLEADPNDFVWQSAVIIRQVLDRTT